MKIKFTCDSSTDLPKELLEKNNIVVKPFTVILGDEERKDGVDVNAQDIFEFVEKTKTLPKTTALNEYDLTEFFKEEVEEDGLIHFSISSKLSCTYTNALNASKNFDNVYVIDTLNITSGIGLLLLYACELREQGLSAKEIVEKVNARRDKVQVSFVTYKLDYLHKGGRCSSIALLGANILKIRPSIIVKDGSMGLHKKYMGKLEKCIEKYIIDTLNEFNTPDYSKVFLTYSSATPEMIETAINTLNEHAKFKNIYQTNASSTITSHCGENTLGIIYFNDGEN